MLTRKQIDKLIETKNLITDYINLEVQLTPNGFDLTALSISEYMEAGKIDFSNNERRIPKTKELAPVKSHANDKFGWWNLRKGAYKVRTNETVNLPNDLMAISFPRSSLLRMGAFVQNAVWDAGFSGKGEFILVVQNPKGLKLKQNARLVQLIFDKIQKADYGYNGIFNKLR